MKPLPDLSSLSLADAARLMAERKLPPVETWHPAHCGDSEMRIARDGGWFHQGAPITRPAMVRLLSTLLRREPDGSYVLVTPVEKLSIAVEDAPFVATAMKADGIGETATLTFQLNTGDFVTADVDHPLRIFGDGANPRPYLHVRGGLEALVTRSLFYELAERALAGDPPGLWSAGCFFPVDVS